MTSLFNSITGVLDQEATEQFTASLSSSEVNLQTGHGQTLTLTLTNTGTDAESLKLSVGSLPTGATVQLGQSNVSLAPGASTTVTVALTQDIQSSTLFNLAGDRGGLGREPGGLCRGFHPARDRGRLERNGHAFHR